MVKLMAFFNKHPLAARQRSALSPPDWRKGWQKLTVHLQPWSQTASSNRRNIVLVNGILLLLIAYNLARLTWLALPTPPQEEAPSLAITADTLTNRVTPVPGNHSITAQEMASWHLFGDASAIAEQMPMDIAPQTSLALSLRGVIATRDKKTARAIIADSTGNENFYAIDAAVPGGAVLKEVHADRVILSRGGSYETLMLPKDEMEFGAPPLPVAVPDGAMLGEYRDALINRPETLADRIQPVPVNEGGKFIGYRFMSPHDPALLARLGMEPGDIVTAVNGMPLDNPLKGMQVLRSLSVENEIRVDTLRNGTPRSFILRMN